MIGGWIKLNYCGKLINEAVNGSFQCQINNRSRTPWLLSTKSTTMHASATEQQFLSIAKLNHTE